MENICILRSPGKKKSKYDMSDELNLKISSNGEDTELT